MWIIFICTSKYTYTLIYVTVGLFKQCSVREQMKKKFKKHICEELL